MTISRISLSHVAALAAAVPNLKVRLGTDSGGTVLVADEPGASLCAHAFRHVMAQWPDETGHSPCVNSVIYEGVRECPAGLAAGDVRWFVTELGAQEAANTLCAQRARDGISIDTEVRYDALLALTVVRLESDELDEDDLDEAALAAYGACVTEHLVGHGAHAARRD